MSEEEANVCFVREMPERKEIFGHELPAVEASPVLPGHKKMCERFMCSLKKGKTIQSSREETHGIEDDGANLEDAIPDHSGEISERDSDGD